MRSPGTSSGRSIEPRCAEDRLNNNRKQPRGAKAGFEMIFRDGTPPEKHKYPGLGYRATKEHGMIIERDVAVPMRDGVKLYVDVHRPESDQKVPALVAWSPYG